MLDHMTIDYRNQMAPRLKELLKRTASETWGLFPASPDMLLNGGRYKVIRLLGYGQYSTVILVADMHKFPNRLYAIKTLSVYATSLNLDRRLNERGILQKVSAVDRNDVLPYLIDSFEHVGPHGKHLSLVLHPLATDLRTFALTALKRRLPLDTIKLVISSVLMSLSTLHRLGIIHTDVKASNVLFNAGEDTVDDLDPTDVLTDGTVEIQGKEYPVLLPQPLEHSFKWDDPASLVELYDLVLIDLGTARRESDPQDYELGTAIALRAPEVILRAGYNTKLDIWAVGCMTFELLTGMWAFRPEAAEAHSIDDDHLARMLELTCEPMPASLLHTSLSSKHLDDNGNLIHIGSLHRVGIEATLARITPLTPKEIRRSADFIRACLHLDPNDRPTADQLQRHPWILSA